MRSKPHLHPKSTEKCKNVLTNVAVEVTNGYIRKHKKRTDEKTSKQMKYNMSENTLNQVNNFDNTTTSIIINILIIIIITDINIFLTRYLVGGAHDLESIFVSFKHSGYFFSGETMELLLSFVEGYFLFTYEITVIGTDISQIISLNSKYSIYSNRRLKLIMTPPKISCWTTSWQ